MGVEREIDPDLCDIDFDELHLEKKPFSDGGMPYHKSNLLYRLDNLLYEVGVSACT
jgi:hypothetical protein